MLRQEKGMQTEILRCDKCGNSHYVPFEGGAEIQKQGNKFICLLCFNTWYGDE